ncbi:hypothetical protein [Amycolatopsis rhizosphaerae]|uniref:hypothetical protein n=1 Tax=Amycolatopsis rhizosphaerae TaxID=2053003 RepID=UPI001643C475|nr:hypothetical protein [Amycolatopsis rhizosphaerae]
MRKQEDLAKHAPSRRRVDDVGAFPAIAGAILPRNPAKPLRHTPLFSLAEPHRIDTRFGEVWPLTFVQAPDLVGALADLPGVRVLTEAELDSSFDLAKWPEIVPDDVTYWKPATVGEALFNYWD